jgi:hydroxymethylglutaryl-CoA lyase
MNLPKRVKIRDVAPRDGFQSWPDFIPTEIKIEIIGSIMAAGVSEMETTSFVSPKAVPQMRDAADVMKGVPRKDGFNHCALVPNAKGAELALEAGVDKVFVVTSASDAHNQANVRRTVAESKAAFPDIFGAARAKSVPVIGGVGVAFGCPIQGDVPEADVLDLVQAYLDGGAESIMFADTTGMGTPARVVRLLEAFWKRFGDVPIGLHFHDNRGTAMANLYAALEAGAEIFDTSLGGIGGCPNVPDAAGNLPTCDVVYMLEEMGIETGVDIDAIIRAARRMEEILKRKLPGQVMKSGPRDPRRAAELCGIGR